MKNEYMIVLLVLFCIVIFALYLFFKIKEKEQDEKIRDLCRVRDDLNLQLSATTRSSSSEVKNFKTTLVYEQTKKIEFLEAEVLKRKERNSELRIIAHNASMVEQNVLTNITDEIQTPLLSILDSCRLLQTQLKDKTSRNQLNNIRDSSNNLLQMLQKLTDLSKIQAETFEIVEKTTDIHSLLQSTLESKQKQADAKSLSLTLNIDKRVPEFLLLDASKVKTIFENLLDNAIKFTQEGSVKVDVVVDAIDSATNTVSLSIHVEDTGVGIEPQSQQKIFEVFENFKNRESNLSESKGFGLSVDKKIALFLDGDITLKSELGKGSIFTFSLSNVEMALWNAQDLEKENVDFSLLKEESQIMVVAPKDANYQTILEAFQSSKVELFAYSDLREAMETLKDRRIELIFIDVDILNRDDGAVSKVLTKITTAAVVPLVTSRIKEIDFKDTQLKPMGFLKKPISKSELFKISFKVLNT